MRKTIQTMAVLSLVMYAQAAYTQGAAEDYQRAFALAEKYRNAVPNATITPRWIDTSSFWYIRDTSQGQQYILVDADRKTSTEMPDDMRRRIVEGGSDNRPGGRGGSGTYWGERDEQRTGNDVPSPDSTYVAYIKNSNVYVKNRETGIEKALSYDGAPGEYYAAQIRWSPDSKKVATLKIRPAEKRFFYMVESSPVTQLQPILHHREYAKPGDALPFQVPHIFHIDGKIIAPTTELFPSQYDLTRLEWDNDSQNLMFDYNERGHKVYRVLELSAETAKVRTVIEEKFDTYVNYSRYFKRNMENGKEIIWMSERDNWNHLYLIDRQTGKVKNQITKGEWYVREIIRVDEDTREIFFTANGREKNQDPYFIHHYRIKMDGTGLICLNPEEGTHTATFSSDYKYLVDIRSRIDMAPVMALRDAKDGKIIMELEKCDLTNLKSLGWIAPEPFVAKGRDGKTDIWGVIWRPTNFDPNKKYPVIEYIYSGPGSAYTPKNFRTFSVTHQTLAELGFIVVQCDGMSTSFRSKTFEEVCYKNLKDAGFPDRIPWMQAAAAKYPYMDIERVGIFGSSAGGQEAMAAVLFHPEFYKAAYSGCGCHDNRMDKIWWNEQWMGYPVDSSYIACSNVENAHLLTRPLMLMVGEMDDNVDPASTMQVVNALIKARKDFELIVIPGMGHSMGGEYGDRKRYDFFVKNLIGVDPPKWGEVYAQF